MKPIIADTDDRRWQAVCDRDVRADGQFVFAVLTTGICWPPVLPFAASAAGECALFTPGVEAAIADGFRPCKRCQPDRSDPQQQKVDKVTRACRLLEQEAPVTLETLAQELAVSPFHFHRLFKSVTGMTPKAWQQAWRARRLREALGQGEKVTPAVLAAGFPGGSSYYRQADAALGMTAPSVSPRRWRIPTLSILSATVRSVAAWSQKVTGACAPFYRGKRTRRCLMRYPALFPHARLLPGDAHFCQRVAQVFAHLDDPHQAVNLPLDLRGTAFQQRVWQALRQIPAGETRSYRQVAQSIGQPRAVRAVAGACAANKLAIVIPCHRVVREGGALSGYRWGTARKAQLLAREAQTEEK
ncbi:Regulatory protein of adaptative response [Raoultella planticola]|uniref:Regulatory protein of adaptative response n=1 Tax=Raoultella planticola TaxID=575 RepID=A0A485ACV6_RAOPL|nr:Regulatory protein of adaptative response [Raoultella planticola]